MLVGVRAGNGSMCLLKGKSVKNQAILVEPAAAQETTAAGSWTSATLFTHHGSTRLLIQVR